MPSIPAPPVPLISKQNEPRSNKHQKNQNVQLPKRANSYRSTKHYRTDDLYGRLKRHIAESACCPQSTLLVWIAATSLFLSLLSISLVVLVLIGTLKLGKKMPLFTDIILKHVFLRLQYKYNPR